MNFRVTLLTLHKWNKMIQKVISYVMDFFEFRSYIRRKIRNRDRLRERNVARKIHKCF